MYANLKQAMQSKGYTTSEGDDWAASDTPVFQSFAVRELGVPFSRATYMLAYPQAFPEALERLHAIGVASFAPSAAPIDPPHTLAEAIQSTLAAEPVAEPVAAPVETTLDLSAPNQMEKQELEQPDGTQMEGEADNGAEQSKGAEEPDADPAVVGDEADQSEQSENEGADADDTNQE